MAFSLSNGIITQTGTNNTISGLGTVSGVTVTELSDGTTIYSTDHKLIIKGTLRFDPTSEKLYTHANYYGIRVSNGGVFEISQDNSHYTVLGLVCSRQSGAASQQSRANIMVERGAQLRIINSEIQVKSTIYLQQPSGGTESSIFISNGKIKGTRGGSQLYVRTWASSLVDVDGIVLENMSWGNFRIPAKFDNPTLINSRMIVEGTDNSGSDTPLVINGFRSLSGSTMQVNGGGIIHAKNTIGGVDPALVKVNSTKGGIVFFADLSVSIKDKNGSGIEGAKLFSSDYDSGNRTTITTASDVATYDYTQDDNISLTTDSNGIATKPDVLLAVFYKDGGVDKVDHRTPNSDNIRSLQICSYLHDLASASLDFSDGAVDMERSLLDDLNIANTNIVNVANLAVIQNDNEFYDRAKLSLLNDFLDPVNRSSDLIADFKDGGIDTGINNVDLDPSALQAFDFSGGTITIKTTTFTGGIKSSGVIDDTDISLVINGTIEDQNGVRVVIRESGGGNFNILAHDAAGKIGFETNVSSAKYTVSKGDSIKIQVWQLGKMLYYKEIDTTDGGVFLDMVMLEQVGVDTSLDVSSIIANTEVDITGVGTTNPIYSVTFKAAMTLPLEEMKSFLHRALGDEDSLTAALDAQGQVAITIQDDEITVNSASFKLYRGPDLSVDDRVIMAGFINVDGVSDPAYQINPRTDSGTHVIIQAEKPTVDYTRMSEKNKEKMEETNSLLDRAHDHAQFANAQTQGI